MPPGRNRKLPRSFYRRPTLKVASDLLGKFIVHHTVEGILSARIVEVEAYIGEGDPACHAYGGITERSRPLFGEAGFSYVYLIYGMYYCFNFVTEPSGKAAAVLLRAAEAVDGIEFMRRRSPGKKVHELLNGPGKLCRSFGITLKENCLDLTGHDLYLEDRFCAVREVCVTPRIGISKGVERLWRFCDADSDSLSQKITKTRF